MNTPVAIAAKRYQVLLGILARVTTELFVVYLEGGSRTPYLAFPGVTSEHLIAKVCI
jgi:hypothetical protein